MRKAGGVTVSLLWMTSLGWAQQARFPSTLAPAQAPAANPSAQVDPASGPPMCSAAFTNDHPTPSVYMVEPNNGIIPPKVKNSVEAYFPKMAGKAMRKQHVHQAVSVLELFVGADGLPRDLCLKQAAGFGLDSEAAKAAMKYRFVPATKDGKPVAVELTIEVKFRLLGFFR